MPGNFLIAEEFGRLIGEFAASLSPGQAPVRPAAKDADYDPLRLRPVTSFAASVDKLLGIQTEVPIEWQLGEYLAANTRDLFTACALSSENVGGALESTCKHQSILTNIRTISHRSHSNGELAEIHNNLGGHDPVVSFLFHAGLAAKLRHFFNFCVESDGRTQIDARAKCFGTLMHRFAREAGFVDIEFRESEIVFGFTRDVLNRKLLNGDDRLRISLDRELRRRAAEIPVTGRWTDRIKYYIRSNHLSEISMEQICDAFCVQRRTLGRLLREEGSTFSSILSELRREKALHLVRSTGMPLKRVADELGFNSDASFCMAFKSWTGMAPMAFRKSAPARSPANDARPIELAVAAEAKKSLRSGMLLSSWSQRTNT